MSPLKTVKDKRFKKKEVEKHDIADQLKKYRKKHKMSQEDLAKVIDVSRQVIARWEINYSYPSKMSLKILKLEGII